MNALGRETLIAAQLRGVRQIKLALKDDHGGFCAMGVLLAAMFPECLGRAVRGCHGSVRPGLAASAA